MTDAPAWRAIIGMMAPSATNAAQPACDELRPRGLTNPVARISIKERPPKAEVISRDPTEAMRSGFIDASDQVMTLEPEPLIKGVALEGSLVGVDHADHLRSRIGRRSGVGVTMDLVASCAAQNAFGPKPSALLSPHSPNGEEVGANLAAMTVAAESERRLGEPTPSMNAIRQGRALRRLGVEDPLLGSGRILEEF